MLLPFLYEHSFCTETCSKQLGLKREEKQGQSLIKQIPAILTLNCARLHCNYAGLAFGELVLAFQNYGSELSEKRARRV